MLWCSRSHILFDKTAEACEIDFRSCIIKLNRWPVNIIKMSTVCHDCQHTPNCNIHDNHGSIFLFDSDLESSLSRAMFKMPSSLSVRVDQVLDDVYILDQNCCDNNYWGSYGALSLTSDILTVIWNSDCLVLFS